MSFIGALKKTVIATGIAVATVTALPVLGAAGVITATGAVIGLAVGTVAGVADEVAESKKK